MYLNTKPFFLENAFHKNMNSIFFYKIINLSNCATQLRMNIAQSKITPTSLLCI